MAPRSASGTGGDASDAKSPDSAAAPSRSSIFGAAQPVDTAAREQALLDAKAEKERTEAAARKAEAEAAAAKSAGSNPFGAAKPVDVTNREKEVEAKLAADKEALNSKMKDAKIAEEASANPKREWRRPAGPNAGLTDQQAQAPQSQLARSSSAEKTSTTNGASTAAAAPPRQIAKNLGIRKEGFSYSNIAGGAGAKPAASEKVNNDGVKKEESKEAEAKSANPGKEWKKPEGPHDGLSNEQAQAPQSSLSGNDGAQTTAA